MKIELPIATVSEANRFERPDDRYCIDCGSEVLLYVETYANGEEWKCKDCGELHMFNSPRED